MTHTVLLVEDDTFITEMYQSKLQDDGFNVLVCPDVFLAEKILYEDKKTVDIILLDMILPGKTGLEMLKTLKSKENFKNIPVLILSNVSAQSDVEEAMTIGAVDYIVKSNFTPSEVVRVIKSHIKN
jgi:DNA-binding response OmpR family regulator